MSENTQKKTERRKALRAGIPMMVGVVVLVILLDQYTKYLVQSELFLGQLVPVIDNFFNITLTYNPGAAFGMFADLPAGTRHLLLGGVSLLAFVVIFYFLVNDYYDDRVAQGGLALIVGGAIGNIIDRVTIGKVVDFLDVYYGPYHWPAFNVADSAIFVGVVILILRRPKLPEEE